MSKALYQKPEILNSQQHKDKRLKVWDDFSRAEGLHAVFMTATEFTQAVHDFPVIFIDTNEKNAAGDAIMSPVGLLGVVPGENLMVDGGRWTGRYMPAFIRRFPFLSAEVPGSDQVSVFVDTDWEGFSDTEGERIFGEDGKPTEMLQKAIDFLQNFDREAQRTRAFCEKIAGMGILESMNAKLTLVNGQELTVDGFFVVNEDKLNALSDAQLLDLQKSGSLALVYAHLMSLAGMQNLVQRKAERMSKETQPAAAAASTEAA